jgi:hypothetical protein
LQPWCQPCQGKVIINGGECGKRWGVVFHFGDAVSFPRRFRGPPAWT